MTNMFEGLDTNGKIKALLASRDLSWTALARLLEVTPETIYNRKEKSNWSLAELRTVAEFFAVDPKELI